MIFRSIILGKNKLFNFKFGDADLKDVLTGGDGDPDGIEVHEHYGNTTIVLIFIFLAASNQEKSLNIHS